MVTERYCVWQTLPVRLDLWWQEEIEKSWDWRELDEGGRTREGHVGKEKNGSFTENEVESNTCYRKTLCLED